MRTAVVILAAIAALSTDGSARTVALRSAGTGAIVAPVAVPPEEPTTRPPEIQAGFALSMAGSPGGRWLREAMVCVSPTDSSGAAVTAEIAIVVT